MKINNIIVMMQAAAVALFVYADQTDKGLVCAVLAVAFALMDDS